MRPTSIRAQIGRAMKIVGLLLMLAGWLIALSAVVLLALGPAQIVFVVISIAIQILGFAVVARSHVKPAGEGR